MYKRIGRGGQVYKIVTESKIAPLEFPIACYCDPIKDDFFLKTHGGLAAISRKFHFYGQKLFRQNKHWLLFVYGGGPVGSTIVGVCSDMHAVLGPATAHEGHEE